MARKRRAEQWAEYRPSSSLGNQLPLNPIPGAAKVGKITNSPLNSPKRIRMKKVAEGAWESPKPTVDGCSVGTALSFAEIIPFLSAGA
jgi:hypothetical protein